MKTFLEPSAVGGSMLIGHGLLIGLVLWNRWLHGQVIDIGPMRLLFSAIAVILIVYGLWHVVTALRNSVKETENSCA